VASKGAHFDGHNEVLVVGYFAERFRLDWAARLASEGAHFDGHNEVLVVGYFAERFRLDWAARLASEGADSNGQNEGSRHKMFASKRKPKVDLLA